MSTGIFSATINIDDIVFKAKPNSISYSNGEPEEKVRALGGSDEVVFTKDLEGAIGMVKFTLLLDLKAEKEINSLKTRKDAFKVTFTDDGFTKTMKEGRIVNKIEPTIGVDGEMEVEIQGTKLV